MVAAVLGIVPSLSLNAVAHGEAGEAYEEYQ